MTINPVILNVCKGVVASFYDNTIEGPVGGVLQDDRLTVFENMDWTNENALKVFCAISQQGVADAIVLFTPLDGSKSGHIAVVVTPEGMSALMFARTESDGEPELQCQPVRARGSKIYELFFKQPGTAWPRWVEEDCQTLIGYLPETTQTVH